MIILSYLVIKPFILSIFLGALLAYIFYPIFRLISRKLNKTLTALIVCLLILILIVIPSVFFVKTIINESFSLYSFGKQKISQGIFKTCAGDFCELIKSWGENSYVKYYSQEGLKSITNWVVKKGSDFLMSIPAFLLNLFVMFFVLFYFLREGGNFTRKVSSYLRMRRSKYLKIVERLKEIVHAIVYGYVLIALFQGALGAVGFLIFGVSSPLFWGMVMAFLALIPYLGTGIIWGPAAAIIFLDGVFLDSNFLMYKGIGLFLYGLIIVGGIDNVLKPKIIGGKAKIHPAVILLGIFGGIFLIGPLGVVIGPIILSLTEIVIQEYLSNHNHFRKIK